MKRVLRPARICVLLAASATCVGLTVAPAPAAPAAPAAASVTGSYMDVTAHEDDDLLFMNPDVQNTINAGLPITSVYLTAGEATTSPGDNSEQTAPDLGACQVPLGDQTREDYAACRQEGSRAAWAAMAGIANPQWDQSVITVPIEGGTRQVEADILEGTRAPITLVFVDLPDTADTDPTTLADDDPTASTPGNSLVNILSNHGIRNTIPVTGSPLGTTPQPYNLDILERLLEGLYTTFAPTVVRIQDPTPDSRYEQNPAWFNDHADHVATSMITAQALSGESRLQVVNYRNYNTQDMPIDLPIAQQEQKEKIFGQSYAVWDTNTWADVSNPPSGGGHCGQAQPSGDPVAANTTPEYCNWQDREEHRFWGGTTWVGRNENGLLLAFAVENGNLLMWSQTEIEGGFTGPVSLGNFGGPLAPGLSVSRNADGRVEVFGIRLSDDLTVTAYQTAVDDNSPSGWSWAGLGNPNQYVQGPSGLNWPQMVGYPVATTNQDGRIQIFEKNGGGGISTTYQTVANGGWTGATPTTPAAWTDLGGGPGIQDGLSTITDSQGYIHIFAYNVDSNGVGSIVHIYQNELNGGFTTDTNFTSLEAASPPTVAANADGRLDVFYRLADGNNGHLGSDVGHTWEVPGGAEPAGSWTAVPQNLVGDAGVGPVGVVNAPAADDGSTPIADARIMLLEHNGGGGMSLNYQVGPNDGYQSSWTDEGGFISNEPALASDQGGEIYMFAIDGQGHLIVNHQTAASGSAPFGGWAQQGS